MIIKKTAQEIDKMAASGAVLVETLKLLASEARVGVTTKELDEIAEEFILSKDAKPAFKGYKGFPASICSSPNSLIVHGIPGPYELGDGDVISIDVGVIKDGWVSDAAVTLPIGSISPVARKLLDVTRGSLFAAVKQCVVGNHLSDISHAVQQEVESAGMSIVRQLVGHGVGQSMHEDPQIPNYGLPGRGVILEEGMVFAIEPMVTAGRGAIRMGDDHWSVFSRDGSLAAHFEFTVAIEANGPRILTPWHELLGEF